MDDSFDFGDDDELLAAVEQVEKQVEDKKHQTVNAIDDDFDDFDDEDFILAAETAEQQASTNKGKERQGQLSNFFASSSTARDTSRQINNELVPPTSLEDEPPPTAPSPPPRNTPCSHEFDAEALPTWIYPVNYSIRLYQWNIVKKALFNNTLVALPTGLGKTFIAAVVMYNYWRWFPQSKIVFMAPTRPLVTQQIEACFQICGIDQSDTVELTGQTSKDRRRQLWMSKRVYFLTPQVLQNDLQSRICPAEKVVCLVVDEAHKAQGNYAYTEVIKLIAQRQAQFRVLALTATPGTNIANVQSVVDNLRITAIQIRTEESMDIQEHTHGKNIQTVVVKLDYTAGATGIVPDTVKNFRDKIFVPVLQRLSRFQAIYSTDVERNTPYQLLMAQRQFTANARNFNQAVKSLVHVDFSIAHSVSRAFEMLCQHGVGPFLATIKGTLQEYRDVLDSNKNLPKEKAKLLNSFDLKRIIDNLKQQQQQPGFMGHPKLQRLLHIILEHLTQAESGTSTRIMVFSSFRTSVDEIVKCLSEHEPMVRCSHFVGQAGAKDGKKGLNQREQQDIISRFKRGDLNVIISTSIGEEGLDIGEVDLIICYDSQSSPLRLLQRMGRTGRKRKGRCVMLMTETEERKYRNAKESYNQVQQAIARGGHLRYFKPNPSVIPENYQPVWRKKRFTIGTFIPAASGSGRSKARNRNEKIVNAEGTLLEGPEASFLQKLGAATVEDAFIRYWPKQHALKRTQKYLPSNKVLHYYHHVGHSRRTMQFVELYNKIEPRILYGSDAPQQQEQQQPTVGNTLYLPRRRNNADGIVIETIKHTESTARVSNTATTATRKIDQSDDYNEFDDDNDDDDAVIFLSKSKAKSNIVQPQENVMHHITRATLPQSKTPAFNRQQSDVSMRHRDSAENRNISLHMSSDTSMHDRSDPIQQQDSDANNGEGKNDDDAEPNLEDGYIKGDSWMEECASLLLLENRLDRSGSYDIAGDYNMLDEFEDILPLDLKKSQGTTHTGASPATSDPIMGSTSLEPFPFKQLSKEEAEDTLISASMLKWLTARPMPTDNAKQRLLERARKLKLDAAKDWVCSVFALPSSPMAASTPSFDDDIDFAILDEWEQNHQKAAHSVQKPEQQSLCQEQQLQQGNGLQSIQDESLLKAQQETEQQHHDGQDSVPIANNIMESLIKLDSSITHYSAPSNSNHDVQHAPEPVNIPDDFPMGDADMTDVTFCEALENKVDDDSRPNYSSANDSAAPEPTSNTSLSPIVIARNRRRRRINLIEDDSDIIHDDAAQAGLSSSSSPVMKRAIQGHRRQRRRLDAANNPFFDLEAEKSSDEEHMGSGHDGNEDGGDESSSKTHDSFINDEATSDLSAVSQPREIYRMSLMSQVPTGPAFQAKSDRRRTWLDRFEADKWIQAGEEEGEEDGEEEEETGTSAMEAATTDDICEYTDDFV